MNESCKKTFSEKFRSIMLSLKRLASEALSSKPRIIGLVAGILVLVLVLVLVLTTCSRNEPTDEVVDATEDVQMEDVEPTIDPVESETQPVGVPATLGTIITGKLNVRKGAGSNFDVVDQYIEGDRVEIHETKDVDGTVWGYTGKGWIGMGYVRMDDETPDQDDSADAGGMKIESNGSYTVLGYGVVDLRTLNVRSGPSTDYAKVKEIPQGVRYAYYEQSGEWVRIGEGWVSTSYFYVEGTTADDATSGTITTDDLNVRSGPATTFRHIDTYMKDDVVQILAVVDGWGYTEKGWISMTYVQPPEPVYATGDATVTIGLNIREEPDPASAKVGAYTEGEHVTIIEVKDGWGRTDKGWINLDYVKYD